MLVKKFLKGVFRLDIAFKIKIISSSSRSSSIKSCSGHYVSARKSTVVDPSIAAISVGVYIVVVVVVVVKFVYFLLETVDCRSIGYTGRERISQVGHSVDEAVVTLITIANDFPPQFGTLVVPRIDAKWLVAPIYLLNTLL